ncbi:ribonuclease III domain-containing protein [Cantharellus anzutake]|uniref:ribonuclease III domain-containing protein n=1 Tax=Cantharellus anzutake TaxID=1750568 RepID=UPI0019050043|nr:ribonuclease III domain-containing protein [Cantharellus anzutake]KAF8339673.1 ribonuclease III domain-containing protein [Cantharellus anzutake]
MASIYHTTYRNAQHPLPELPQIKTVQIWDEVFTHQSLPNNNGVLSILGQNVLATCVAEWLIDADPALSHEELRVRSNERLQRTMLSAFAMAYDLPQLLRFAKNMPPMSKFTIENEAAVFEAFVGAVHREYGFDTVKEWLYALMDWDNV